MEVSMSQESPRVHKIPQSKYVDGVRWLPQVSALNKFAAFAFFDSDAESFSVEIQSLDSNPEHDPTPVLTPLSSWTSKSRLSSLEASAPVSASYKPLVSAATSSGSLHVLSVDLVDEAAIEEAYVAEGKEFHVGRVVAVDWREGGGQCVSVGEDGRVNVVTVVNGEGLRYRRVFDGNGLVAYNAAKWASPSEFVTGGYGFSLHWWDQRKPGGVVSQFRGTWSQGTPSGIVHSVDIHPSRKHTCVAGGSSGTVFIWDIRWPQQPIVLSGAAATAAGESAANSICESDVWEVKYQPYASSTVSSSKILPVMICSEDGILAVVEQGEEPVELLAESCAINGFDIDRQNPSLGVGIHSHLDQALNASFTAGGMRLELNHLEAVRIRPNPQNLRLALTRLLKFCRALKNRWN